MFIKKNRCIRKDVDVINFATALQSEQIKIKIEHFSKILPLFKIMYFDFAHSASA